MTRVVVLWRPDTTTGIGPPATPNNPHVTWIAGKWASDRRIYTRDQLPRSYPQLPFFSQLADAAHYLTASRDHTACQLELEECRRHFPDLVTE